MKKFYFLFIILLIRTNSQIIENPIFLDHVQNPFVLSITDDEYYYVHGKGKSFKIKKESGIKKSTSSNFFTLAYHLYIFDNSNNNYVYSYNSGKYWHIKYNPFISYEQITINAEQVTFNKIGSIAQDNGFIIYGYTTNYLIFLNKSRYHSVSTQINNINDNLSCKFINGNNFICVMIINNKININCLKYQLNETHMDSLSPYDYASSNINYYFNYATSAFGFYDTGKDDVKFLCIKIEQSVLCKFLNIKIEIEENKYYLNLLGDGNLVFAISYNFKEKNCYFSIFNSEYLFCCAITNYIKYFRINSKTYNKLKEFNIERIGNNSYLTIKNNSDYATLFFMNQYNNINSVYEYYIYLPKCENKTYTIFNTLNENKPEENLEQLRNLFTVKTNKYYFEIKNNLNEFGYFTLNKEKVNQKILITNNDYILDFIITNNDKWNSFEQTFDYIVSIEDEEAYTKECHITLTFKTCYHSCKNCSLDNDSSNDKQHNCIICRDNYYPSPINKSNCYLKEEKELNWYFDTANSEFRFCHEECLSCTGPSKFNCSSCSNGLYLDNNSCKLNCSEGYFSVITELNNSGYYFTCNKCYKNCKTCLGEGDAQKMNCEICKENQIKYNDSCFDIKNSSTKTFYEPESNNLITTNCYEKFGLYIKGDSNECIPLPKEEEGYYISNNETGLLSKCHENCFSCNNGPIKDSFGNILSMECNKCKDSNNTKKTMIKNQNNCFEILQYNDSKIIFNISEMIPNILGTCIHFGKAIYYGKYECISKPDNTYYIINETHENTGMIKNCSEACITCLGEGNSNNTNCKECAKGYFKTEDSNSHCTISNSISPDYYYLNISNNIYYHCYHNCKGCNGSYNPKTNDMYCLDCINDYYFIYGKNNCHNFTLLEKKEYYFNFNDSKFHRCYYTCSECFNFEPNETNHFCRQCISGYFFLENTNNCYGMNLTDQGYYLDNIHLEGEDILFRKCYNSCRTCDLGLNSTTNGLNHNCKECKDNYYRLEDDLFPNNCYDNETLNELKNLKISTIITNAENSIHICLNNTFITSKGECVLTCPNGTFQFSKNNSCLDSCPSNYGIVQDKCIIKSFDSDLTSIDFKNQIRGDITSYVNSSKVINGSNFLAVVLSTDNMNPEEQLKNGISAIDLGNCTNVIKEYYNISKQENLIVLNMETKKDESQKNESINNDDKSFNLGKNTQLEIYDYSGRKLNLSVCKEDIKVIKYIGDVEGQLDMDSAKVLSTQGIDVFNENDEFFNDICHQYENSEGKDMILNDRRNDLYQNATFCQDGCTYNGINYNLKAVNCICDSSLLQEEENSITNIEKESKDNNFKSLTKSFVSGLIDFNFDILRCNNLVLNTKILIHNIGFYCLSLMFFLQIIFFLVYLIKKLKPLKNFMLMFKINNNINCYQKNYIINTKKINKNHIKEILPPKNGYYLKNSKNENYNIQEPKKVKKYIKSTYNNNKKNISNNKGKISSTIIKEKSSKNKIIKKNDSINNDLTFWNSKNILNYKKISEQGDDSNKTIKNNSKEVINLDEDNNERIYNIKSNKRPNIQKNIFVKKVKDENYTKEISNLETIQGKNNNYNIESKVNNLNIIKLSKAEFDIQDLDYEEAIIYDKRSFLRMYWGFLVDSQIILGTFFTGNYFDLFIIKLSFLVYTFQISFFLNALFYTDEYISESYHNDGILDFFSGLPKSIYSFIATLITTNLLRMLSSSKNELMRVIRRSGKFQNYIDIINIILTKLRKKLIIYFILVFLLESFFLYYVTAFCAVYRYSQKYWFIGCLESFGIDSFVTLIICIFLALFRYIGIKTHIKCFYILAKIINTFL